MSNSSFISTLIPYLLAKKKVEKSGGKLPTDAYIGLLPLKNDFLNSYLITDNIAKKTVADIQVSTANKHVSELVTMHAATIDAAAAVTADITKEASILAVKNLTPSLQQMIVNKVTVAAARAELIKVKLV